MSVDLRELAIDRPQGGGQHGRKRLSRKRHVATRYGLPMLLLAGFAGLALWGAWEVIFPATRVKVVPVIAMAADAQVAGTALFRAAGWVEPRPTSIRAAALAPGVVEKLLVVEDQPVRAGQPVAELVKDDAQLAHERALTDLQLRKAELAEAKAARTAAATRYEQPVHLEAALAEADALLARIKTDLQNLPFALRRARADLDAAEKDYEGKAAAEGVVARVEVDVAKSKVDSAAALVEELRDRAAALENERLALDGRRNALQTQLELLADERKALGEADAKVRAAEARVAQAKVLVAEAKLRLDRMTVRAPIDGRVYQLVSPQGARIGAGMTQMLGHDGSTIVTMYDPDQLQVRVDVRFEDVPKVQLRQPVEIDNAALAGPIPGEVLFVSSEADIQKNTLQVKVAIPDPPPLFKPEMLVDATFLAPAATEPTAGETNDIALYIPAALVDRDGDAPRVWIADQSTGRARRVAIELGAPGPGDLIKVIRGLNAGSRLIATGRDQLHNNARIEVVGEETTLGITNSPMAN